MIRELDCVALTVDLPEHGLTRDTLGAVVFVHDDGPAFEVEFVSPAGETLALLTLSGDQIRRVAFDDAPERRDSPIGNSPPL